MSDTNYRHILILITLVSLLLIYKAEIKVDGPEMREDWSTIWRRMIRGALSCDLEFYGNDIVSGLISDCRRVHMHILAVKILLISVVHDHRLGSLYPMNVVGSTRHVVKIWFRNDIRSAIYPQSSLTCPRMFQTQ